MKKDEKNYWRQNGASQRPPHPLPTAGGKKRNFDNLKAADKIGVVVGGMFSIA